MGIDAVSPTKIDARARRSPRRSTENGRCAPAYYRPRGPAAADAACRPSRTSVRPTARDGLRETHSAVDRPHQRWTYPADRAGDMLRCRRWCSPPTGGVRCSVDGRKGGLIESGGVLDVNRETEMAYCRLPRGSAPTTSVDRLRWKGYLKPGSRDDASETTSSRSGSPISTCSTT